jgi:hypothetical protein
VYLGRAWYAKAAQDIHEVSSSYRERFDTTAALVAILSPGSKWESNIDDACAVLEYWELYKAGTISAVDFGDVRVLTYKANVGKAWSLLYGMHESEMDPEDAIRKYCTGPKVSAFYRCLVGDADSLCLDSHAINAWCGRRVTGTKLPGVRTESLRRCRADYIRAASLAGETVASFQAIVWLRHRERINQGRVTGYSRILKKGV